MANIKIPYALTPAVAVDDRREHMRSAIARGLPRLARQPARTDALHVACYGPSLHETWQELRHTRPIVAVSGATKFLAERGITADFAIIMDPRRSQLVVALPPVPGVTYLVASCVHPEVFEQLLAAGNRVVLWHTVSTNWDDERRWVRENDPEKEHDLVVHPGSTVGLAALQIGGVLGFSRFEIHGMDGSFDAEGQRHAGPHGCKAQPKNITWDAGGVTYHTSKIMANAVAETINTAKNFPIITVWHGHGLTQALIREANLANACCADETEKRAHLTGVRPRIAHTPPLPSVDRASFWDALLSFLRPEDWPELVQHIALCEPLRARARYNTGSIPFESAVYLRAISRFYTPNVIAEIGTFIGTSTRALLPGRVLYTCDRSNDCVAGTETILTHPYTASTQMLREIQEPVDLFFFDGRIQPEDLSEIQRLSHPGTVYVVDDFQGQEKGVANVHHLKPLLSKHAIIPPAGGPSTIAIAVPFVQQVTP